MFSGSPSPHCSELAYGLKGTLTNRADWRQWSSRNPLEAEAEGLASTICHEDEEE